MNVSKRLVSGILSAILALGGVSAKCGSKRVSKSNSLSTGEKVAIGGVVFGVPATFVLWKLFNEVSKSKERFVPIKKEELAVVESEANPEMLSSNEEIINILNKLYAKCASISEDLNLIPGVQKRNNLSKFLRDNVCKGKYSEDFVDKVLGFVKVFKDFGIKLGIRKGNVLPVRVSYMLGEKGPFSFNAPPLEYEDDDKETDWKEVIILPFLKMSIKDDLKKIFEMCRISAVEDEFYDLLDLVTAYLYCKCDGETKADEIKGVVSEFGWK